MSLRSPCVTSGLERFFLDLSRAVENYWKGALEVGCGGVVRP